MLRNVLSFILQNECPLCNRSGPTALCSTCQRRLESDRFPTPEQFWNDQKIFAWGVYANTLKRTISVMKYERHPELAVPLGEWLAQSWVQRSVCRTIKKVAIVPIPLHPERQQQRGYNQSELIARAFCNITGDPLYPQGLQRVRATEALFNLSATERERTLEEAFEIGKNFRPPLPVLLIDDIYTTGATVRSSIQVLHRHGIRVVGVAVVARTLHSKNTAQP
jgi:ComF family protein